MRGIFIIILTTLLALPATAQRLSAQNLIAVATCADSACYHPMLLKQGFKKDVNLLHTGKMGRLVYYSRRDPGCLGHYVDSLFVVVQVVVGAEETYYINRCDTAYKLLCAELQGMGYESIMSVDDANATEKSKREFTQRYHKAGSPVDIRIEAMFDTNNHLLYNVTFTKK